VYGGTSTLRSITIKEALMRRSQAKLRERLVTRLDLVYAQTLKHTAIHIAQPLADIFNSLLQLSKVLKEWLDWKSPLR
jgi:hypothetical protein